jgi:hypothetical protein
MVNCSGGSVPLNLFSTGICSFNATAEAVDQLFGDKPEARLRFIQDRAEFVRDLEI